MVIARGARALFVAAFVLHAAAEAYGREVTEADLATLRDIEGLSVSPDGLYVSFRVRQANPRASVYDTGWYVLRTDGSGRAQRVGAGGEPILGSIVGRVGGFIEPNSAQWSADGRWLTYLRRDGDDVQIWRSRRDGSGTERVTRNEARPQRFMYSSDGQRILFEVGASRAQINAALKEEGVAGFRYDRRFFPSYNRQPVLPMDVDLSQDAQAQSVRQRARRGIWVYDLRTRAERAATVTECSEFKSLAERRGPEHKLSPRDLTAMSGNGSRAWTAARDTSRQGVLAPLTIVVRVAGEEVDRACEAPQCTGQFMRGLWWGGEDEIIFMRGEGPLFEDTALYAWRTAETAPRLIMRTSSRMTGGYEWDCEMARRGLICFYEEAHRPRRLVAIDLDTGAVQTLYEPNPDFARFELGAPPKRLEIRAASGVESYGYLVLPPSRAPSERLPLVIVTYRCAGFLRGGVGDEYPIYPFALQGHAVLCFHTPSENFERLAVEDGNAYGRWARGPGEPMKHRVQQALDAAVDQLNAMGVIDPQRVGLAGLSLGAETVSFALFSMPRLSVAIASGVGFEPNDYHLFGPAAREVLRDWGLGAPDGPSAQRWSALSLSANAWRVSAPLLLNVPDHEMLSTLQPVTALEDAGRAVEMYVFPDEYHNKWQPAHRLAIYRRNIDWMNFWLRGVEDSDPVKAEQYTRWRAMRMKQCELFKGDDAPWYCRR